VDCDNYDDVDGDVAAFFRIREVHSSGGAGGST